MTSTSSACCCTNGVVMPKDEVTHAESEPAERLVVDVQAGSAANVSDNEANATNTEDSVGDDVDDNDHRDNDEDYIKDSDTDSER